MRTIRTAIVAGAAAIVLAGFAGHAIAQTSDTHVLNVQLPNGAIEQIRYTGDIAPTVALQPEMMSASPFSMFDRISAMMDRQAAAMIRSVNAMQAQPMQGSGGWGIIPATAGPGVCMRSVQITYSGNQAPHVLSRTSGDCGPAHDRTAPAALPAAPIQKRSPNIIEASAANPG